MDNNAKTILIDELKERYDIDTVLIELLSKSSNYVYLLHTRDDKKLIVKVGDPAVYEFSPFWNLLQSVFGLDLAQRYEQQPALVKKIGIIGMLVPQVQVYEGELGPVSINSYIEGKHIDEDEFPHVSYIHRQLGSFVGAMHSLGARDSFTPKDYGQPEMLTVLKESYSQTAKRFWKDSKMILKIIDETFENLSEDAICGHNALIMPDISANQFVYSTDQSSISGIVDIDSYVVGPIEWELVVLEMCISDKESFLARYTKYLDFPQNFSKARNLFRLAMYLGEPDSNEDWESFSSRNLLF